MKKRRKESVSMLLKVIKKTLTLTKYKVISKTELNKKILLK